MTRCCGVSAPSVEAEGTVAVKPSVEAEGTVAALGTVAVKPSVEAEGTVAAVGTVAVPSGEAEGTVAAGNGGEERNLLTDMINKSNITDILASVRDEFSDASEKDIAYLILCDAISDRQQCYSLIYGKGSKLLVDTHHKSGKIVRLYEVLEPFGIGVKNESITKDQNKDALIKLLKDIKKQKAEGNLDAKDALKMEADIRVKLNDKFDIEEDKKERRIIVVPQKHDLICPHTQRECTSMPTKEACIKYYDLKENK